MDEEILTFEEARNYLKVSRSTLYNWIHQKKIPVVKAGRCWRFQKEKIISWLEEQAQHA